MLRRPDPKVADLGSLPVFSGCDRKQLETIARMTDEVRFPTGAVLMHEGATGRECFVIVDGEAVVRIDGNELARLGRGSIVGEMSLLDREPRSATVVAATPVRAIVMTTLQFAAITDACPSVAMKVMGTLAQRLREVQAA